MSTSGSSVSSLTPHQLPLELVLQILQLTASISRSSAFNVSLVSSWARKIALPYIFLTVVRRNKPWTAVEAASMVRSALGPSPARWRPPTDCGQLVRHLWTENIDIAARTNEKELFLSCPNVEDLVLAPTSLRALSDALQHPSASVAEHKENPPLFGAALRSITLTSHTFRYDWHFLTVHLPGGGAELLHRITHLRILDMKISSYVPHAYLPNLTHVALPYLDLMPNIGSCVLRVPDGLLARSSLQMLVLTLDESKWLGNPWYHTALHAMPGSRGKGSSTHSPRQTFRELVRWAREIDDRIYIVLSPRADRHALEEWEEAASGGRSIWDEALDSRKDENYGSEIPDAFSRTMLRW